CDTRGRYVGRHGSIRAFEGIVNRRCLVGAVGRQQLMGGSARLCEVSHILQFYCETVSFHLRSSRGGVRCIAPAITPEGASTATRPSAIARCAWRRRR